MHKRRGALEQMGLLIAHCTSGTRVLSMTNTRWSRRAGESASLRHFRAGAADACVLWCSVIPYALVLTRAGWASRIAPSQGWPTRHLGQRLDRRGIGAAGILSEQRRVVTRCRAGVVSDPTTPVPVDDSRTGVFRRRPSSVGARTPAVRAQGYDRTRAAIAGGLVGAAYMAHRAVPETGAC